MKFRKKIKETLLLPEKLKKLKKAKISLEDYKKLKKEVEILIQQEDKQTIQRKITQKYSSIDMNRIVKDKVDKVIQEIRKNIKKEEKEKEEKEEDILFSDSDINEEEQSILEANKEIEETEDIDKAISSTVDTLTKPENINYFTRLNKAEINMHTELKSLFETLGWEEGIEFLEQRKQKCVSKDGKGRKEIQEIGKAGVQRSQEERTGIFGSIKDRISV